MVRISCFQCRVCRFPSWKELRLRFHMLHSMAKKNTRAEINEIETIKIIKINNTKSWFCSKIGAS